MLCQFFWIIQSQADIFIAGRQLDPHMLGLYAEALFLTQIFTAKFVPPLNEVAFPAYAELDKSGGAIGAAFAMSVRMTMFVAFPLYFGMAAVAEPMVATLFGAKWMEMVPLVRVMALAMPFFAMQIVFSPATNALGRPGIYVRTSLAGAIIMTAAFLVGAPYGVSGLAAAWVVGTPLMLGITVALSRHAIGTGVRALFAAIWPSALSALVMGGLVHLARPMTAGLSPPTALAILVALGGAIYLGLSWLLDRDAVSDLYQLVTKRQRQAGA